MGPQLREVPRQVLPAAFAEFLVPWSGETQVFEHEPVFTSRDVERVVQAPPSCIVKAMAVVAGNVKCVVATTSDRRIDIKAISMALGVKAHIADRNELSMIENGAQIEHGGMSPLPVIPSFEYFLDSLVLQNEQVYCGAGRNTFSLRLSGQTLGKIFERRGRVIPCSKNSQSN
ncbi:MAG: YbaK/EbsC family protein [Dehalococcoidia bacterium]